MSSALYRKYRPQTFSQMIGQNHIKITLQHELAKGEIGHAYLFCGPRGLGKTTSARLFAKSVNCERRQATESLPAGQASEPCNECQSCLDIIAGRSVDIIEIDAASNTGVDNVRENIIENSRFNPIRSKYKVFIIDEVHMLSVSAFNALLKIMEEPPEQVIFILCTTEIHKVPATIISRCQRFDFKKVTGEQLLKRLQLVVEGENKKVEEEVLKRIIVNSEGCVRDAESLLAKVLSLGNDISVSQAEIVLPHSDFESISAFIDYLAENNAAAAIELINRLVEDGVDLVNFTDGLLEFMRQMLLVKASGRLEDYGIELSAELNKKTADLAEKFNWAEIVEIIEIIGDKAKEIRSATIPQLPLEIAVIRITQKVTCQKPDTISFAVPTAAGEPKTEKLMTEKNTKETTEKKLAAVAKIEASVQSVKEELDLSEIILKWPQIVQKLINTNFTLGSLLKISQPIKADNNCLQIAVSSDFFRGRLESSNNRPAIEQAIECEIGKKVLVKGVVTANIQPIEMTIEYADAAVKEKEPTAGASAESVSGPARLSPAEEVMNLL